MGKNIQKVEEYNIEALILKGPSKREEIKFRVGRVSSTQKKIKYLGVVVNNNMLFGQHAKRNYRDKYKRTNIKNETNVGGTIYFTICGTHIV